MFSVSRTIVVVVDVDVDADVDVDVDAAVLTNGRYAQELAEVRTEKEAESRRSAQVRLTNHAPVPLGSPPFPPTPCQNHVRTPCQNTMSKHHVKTPCQRQ